MQETAELHYRLARLLHGMEREEILSGKIKAAFTPEQTVLYDDLCRALRRKRFAIATAIAEAQYGELTTLDESTFAAVADATWNADMKWRERLALDPSLTPLTPLEVLLNDYAIIGRQLDALIKNV